MGQKLIAFKVCDEDYDEIAKLSPSESPNLIAKRIVLDSLIKHQYIADKTLTMTVRTIAFLQRYAEASLTPDKLTEVFTLAINDEKEMAIKLGINL